MIERRAGIDRVLAMPWVLPGAPLARPGAHALVDAAAARAMAELQRELRSAGGLWSLYRPEGPRFEPAPGDGSSRTSEVETAIVSLDRGAGEARRAMDRKTRQSLEREREALWFAEEAGALGEAFTLHARQARGWSGYRPLPIELSRRLLAARGADGEPVARLFTVRGRGGLLSATLALDGAHETFLWWSGTREEGRGRQAFGVLAWSVVEWAAGRGRRRVNLGASPGLQAVAAFKDSFGAAPFRYPVRWLGAEHAPWPARAIARVRAALRGARP